MPLLDLIRKPVLSSIGVVTIDADISTEHTAEWIITDHPIETGSSISDHKIRKPREITISGMISNIPFGIGVFYFTFSVKTLLTGNFDKNRSVTAWEQLQEIANSSELVSVVTSLESFDNMQITSLRAVRTVETGKCLDFVATLKEVQTVESQEVLNQLRSKRVKRGKKPVKKPTPAQDDGVKKSFLYKWIHGA